MSRHLILAASFFAVGLSVAAATNSPKRLEDEHGLLPRLAPREKL
jgi:hypothetical protein